MHTIGRDRDGTWWVGRSETSDGSSVVMLLFHKMRLEEAVDVCCALNGGGRAPPQDLERHVYG